MKIYAPLADEWYVIDNSNNAMEVAHRKNGKEKIVAKEKFKKHFT